MTSTFKDENGFARRDVTLANWRTAPFSRWAFHNVRDLVPTAEFRSRRPEPEEALDSRDRLDARLETALEGAATIRAYLEKAQTDGFLVMRGGRVVLEHYAAHSGVNARHIVFSISKSLTALLSGILEAEGVIDPDRPVSHYLPEAKGGAYGDCSYRDVLDMRISLDFEEAYLDPKGAFARYRRAMLWNPPLPDETPETLAGFLMTLKKGDGPHGGPFSYASPNSDMLGTIIERVTGARFSDLFEALVWHPLGATNDGYVTVDAIGTPRTAGGMCVSARDLARIGELIRTGGVAGGKQVVPEAWIVDMTQNGDRQAWQEGRNVDLPNGRYRSQWYQSGEEDGAYCAIGIHGQWLYVDPSTETVIVKLSSQDDPLGDETNHDMFTFFRTLCRMAL
ncbi:hypothetical protein GGQ64_004399 [Rhizobium azooxidifex]|uniref:Beta-lactamase-related domain-containing protein n=1 Tax=Mycoplana azooxidifex TaxID=1636188 RepID=A0A7W6D9G4_9HYPH|nr:hypothetical protein [Mycoplana azooxidifex]